MRRPAEWTESESELEPGAWRPVASVSVSVSASMSAVACAASTQALRSGVLAR
ncbi:MAG: hypothetical protein QOG81_1975, partial [Gaiellaceae bacterium]|nr:hypothetical protein [Gaiellaceae bacterium]